MAAPRGISRRNLVTGMAALGMAGVTARKRPSTGSTSIASPLQPVAHAPQPSPGISVPTDGNYATVPLAKATIRLSVIQSRVRGVDISRLRTTRRANLNHMLQLIDTANNWGGPKDLLLFHEFPITGYSNRWNRQ